MNKCVPVRTHVAVGLCIALLLCCLAAMAAYMTPVLRRTETKGDAFGMMLINIADEETADHYHVREHGVYVFAVQEKSPAHLAGISSGDLLLSVNRLPIPDTGAFVNMQDGFVLGQQIEMRFRRGAANDAYAVTLTWNEE